jgi:hypothetical protein
MQGTREAKQGAHRLRGGVVVRRRYRAVRRLRRHGWRIPGAAGQPREGRRRPHHGWRRQIRPLPRRPREHPCAAAGAQHRAAGRRGQSPELWRRAHPWRRLHAWRRRAKLRGRRCSCRPRPAGRPRHVLAAAGGRRAVRRPHAWRRAVAHATRSAVHERRRLLLLLRARRPHACWACTVPGMKPPKPQESVV